jgi:hypothetical protein
MDLISAYRWRDKGESLLVAKKEKKERKKEEIWTHARAIYLMILYGEPERVRNRRWRIDVISSNAKVRASSREDNGIGIARGYRLFCSISI